MTMPSSDLAQLSSRITIGMSWLCRIRLQKLPSVVFLYSNSPWSLGNHCFAGPLILLFTCHGSSSPNVISGFNCEENQTLSLVV